MAYIFNFMNQLLLQNEFNHITKSSNIAHFINLLTLVKFLNYILQKLKKLLLLIAFVRKRAF